MRMSKPSLLRSMVFVVMAPLIALCSCTPGPTNNAPPQETTPQRPKELLISTAADNAEKRGTDPRVIRERAVSLNRSILNALPRPSDGAMSNQAEMSRTFSVDLFQDARFVVVLDHFERLAGDSETWTGHLTDADGFVSLVLNGSYILATIRVPDRGLFRIVTVGEGQFVQELDQTKFKEPLNPIRPRVTAPKVAPSPLATPDDGSVTEILVLYTPAARDAAAKAAGHAPGTTTDINLRVDSCISETNAAYRRSLVTTTLNLVQKGPTTYTGDAGGAGSLNTILDDLTKKGDGKLDEAHTLRDAKKADVVILLVDDNDEGGLANAMDNTNNTAAFEAFAFGVVPWDDALDNLNFSHEVGHIQGCDHDREHTSSRGVYDYSFGYRFDCKSKTYHTIMSYRPGILIPYFSNPAVKYPDAAGCPTGVAEGKPKACEEAKTISNTRVLVANFRPRNP